MYYYMSLCNIPCLTSSLEPLQGFASNFVWMFLGWTLTKFVESEGLPLFMGNFVQFLAHSKPGGLVSSLFKLGHSDLYLRF